MSTYKTSTLNLYYASTSAQWELLPHKLFVIDDISNYLLTKTALTVSLFQYQKIKLELDIVVDLSQTYAEPLINSSFKYASISNSDDPLHVYYYFVKSIEWRAKSAVRLHLVMDVLNTYKEGTHYNFKANTKITREHKDRFIITDKKVRLTIANIPSSVGTLSPNDTVVLRNTNQGNIYLFTGKIVSYDQDYLTLIVEDDLSRADLVELLAPITLYGDLVLVNKDNSNYIEAYFDNYDFYFTYFRNIDYIPENINPILQCGNAEGTLIENNKSLLQCDWFLLYRNESEPDPSDYVNPVECYLLPSEEIEVLASDIVAGRLNATSLNLSYYYYLHLNATLLRSAQSVTLDNGITITPASDPTKTYVVLKRNSDNTISVEAFEGASGTNKQLGVWTCKYITLNNLPFYYKTSATYKEDSVYNISQWYTNTLPAEETWTNTITPTIINDVTKLYKADSKNIKLIKLPYCPYDFTISSNKIDVTGDSNWDYIALTQADNSKIFVLKLNDLNTALHTSLTLSSSSNNPLEKLAAPTINPNLFNTRLGYDYESKLYNSEFYRGTYVYDSFQFAIQLEKCDIDNYLSVHNMTVYFDMTKTINSKFMFTFDSYYLRNATESYAKYMPIARNNEEVLYNVPYVNYIRTGFNYDVKSKNISNASTWIGVGLSATSFAASLVLPTVPLKALGIVTSIISMAMTAKSAITTTIQNEQSIDRKLKEASMQTASVSGADDVDLMSIYAENRLKYLVYEPNPVMKEMLYNLFFYAGYTSNRLGIPSHNTRANFDYLECDAVIEKISNIPDDCLTELVNAFKYGVTYIHKTARNTDKWDLKQVYENWEVSLL